jgi:uncharacterized membrane protein YdbT with pleckstrin-like domain
MIKSKLPHPVDPVSAEGVEPDVGDLSSPDSAAMLPPQLLQPGELIILMIKPSPLYIVLTPLRAIVAIAVTVLIFDKLIQAGFIELSRQDVSLAGFFLIGLRLFWQFLDWVSRVYVLTDRRIIRVKGILRVEVFETSLKQIQHTELFFSIRERMFSLGTISIATAGTFTSEAYWRMVSKPLEIHQTIIRTLDRYR